MTGRDLDEMQNPDNWADEGEAGLRPAVKSARAIVSVAFSRDDLAHVAAAAQAKQMKLSEFIRAAALDQAKPVEQRPATYQVYSVTGARSDYMMTRSRAASVVKVSQPDPLTLTG